MNDEFKQVGDRFIGSENQDTGITNAPASESESKKMILTAETWFCNNNVKLSSSLKEPLLEIAEKKDLRKTEPTTGTKSASNEQPKATESLHRKPQLSKDKFQEIGDTIADGLVTGAVGYSSIVLYGKSKAEVTVFNMLVDHVAHSLKADVLSFGLDDLADLAKGWLLGQSPGKDQDLGQNEDEEDDDKDNDDEDDEESSDRPHANNPFAVAKYYFGTLPPRKASDDEKERNKQAISALLGSVTGSETVATQEQSSESSKLASSRRPIIVHVGNGNKIIEAGYDSSRILTRLREAIEEKRKVNQSVVLLVSNFGDEPFDSSRKKATGDSHLCDYVKCRRLREELCIEKSGMVTIRPSHYSRQECAMGGTVPKTNLSRLARDVCCMMKDEKTKTLFDFLADKDVSNAQKALQLLGATDWTSDELQRVAQQICGRSFGKECIEIEDVVEILERVRRAIGKTGGINEDGQELKGLPLKERVRRLRDSCNKYKTQLIDKLIDPEDLQYSYDDVIMGEDSKATCKQLVALTRVMMKGSSLLLQQLQMKGLLFYCLPGTDRTHLVRAIAKETNAAMLAVDSASIKNKWDGESEKLIEATFTLAVKLHPCVVFIDEVDSLFYRRSSDDKSWERAQLTQFLLEMDGIGTKKNGPIVIAATNRPKGLDNASLRRLPQKVLLKLPDESARLKVLRVFVKDEDLDPEVRAEQLAKTTNGFSGADLKNLCEQTALAWAVELSGTSLPGEDEVKP